VVVLPCLLLLLVVVVVVLLLLFVHGWMPQHNSLLQTKIQLRSMFQLQHAAHARGLLQHVLLLRLLVSELLLELCCCQRQLVQHPAA
jgi:hypothetical protein